jgi:hypothetical protein
MGSVVQPHEFPTTAFPKYTKVYTLGDPKVRDLFAIGEVVLEEKVDGSQFRFGVNANGELWAGSHRVDFTLAKQPDKMFQKAVDYVESIKDRLQPGWAYFGEFLATPRHNTIAYERTPKNGIMLFDVYTNPELTDNVTNAWLSPTGVQQVAEELDVDGPRIFAELSSAPESFQALVPYLERKSYLGSAVIEGIVLKNYSMATTDPYHGHCPMMAKYVRQSFAEENRENWRQQRDIGAQLIARFKTVARWEKAVLHLRDDGKLEGSMRDMKNLVQEIQRDIDEEAKDAIVEMLWNHFEGPVKRGVLGGFAEWYKDRLATGQFSQETTPALQGTNGPEDKDAGPTGTPKLVGDDGEDPLGDA